MARKITKKAIIAFDKILGLVCDIIVLGIVIVLVLMGANSVPENPDLGISMITLGLVIYILVKMPSGK
jgi:hypothetical protein